MDVPEPKSFFTEPKRRNVFRVAIAYVATAWLLAQVADLVFDNFGTPEWVGKTVLFLLALGLPVAILLAWAYELTPEGIKREGDVDRSESITPATGRKLNLVIIAVLVAAVGLLLFDKFILRQSAAPRSFQPSRRRGLARALAVFFRSLRRVRAAAQRTGIPGAARRGRCRHREATRPGARTGGSWGDTEPRGFLKFAATLGLNRRAESKEGATPEITCLQPCC